MPRRSLLAVLACLILAGCGASQQSFGGSVHPPGWGQTPPGYRLTAPPPTAVPIGVMFDAVTLSAIPSRPFAVAGYTSGLFPTWPHILARFPGAHHVSIAIDAAHHADCLDIEPRDAIPSQAGRWARADIAAGFPHPCLYSDLSQMPAVRASLNAAGLARSQYFLWLAWYRHIPGLVAGYDAVQWTDTALGRSLDQSTVSLRFLQIAQPPYVTPHPAVLPVCITHRMTRTACARVRAEIAADRQAAARARAQSARARRTLRVHHCRRPYRRGVCVRAGRTVSVNVRRASYFTANATAATRKG